MKFILLVLVLWGAYVFFIKNTYEDKFVFGDTMIPLIFTSILSTLCLGINYIASAIPKLNDGIGIHTLLAHLIISGDNWSIELFKNYFDISLYISLFLIFTYSILKVLKK